MRRGEEANAALELLRDIVHSEPSIEEWQQLCALLDELKGDLQGYLRDLADSGAV